MDKENLTPRYSTGGIFDEIPKGGVTPEPKFTSGSGSCDPIPPPEDENELKRLIHSAPPPADREFAWPNPITEEEIRDALTRESRKHSCWRGGAVRRMDIQNVECLTALHYSLETFTESRSTCQATESCSVGQFMSTFNSGTVTLDPWEINSFPSQMFQEETKVIELPGTTELAGCSSCGGQGVSHCFHCRGFGTDRCQYCRGTGMKAGIPHPAVVTHPMVATYPHADFSRGYPGTGAAVVRPHGGLAAYGKGTPIHFHSLTGIPPPGIGTHDLCYFCHGRGIKECHHCKGHGKKTCAVCGGSGSVRTFTKLKIKYGVERSEHFDEGGVPEKLLRDVSGEIVLAECRPLVLPLRNYPVDEMNNQSKRLLQIHLNKCLGVCKIIQQRHTLEAVPVARVSYRLGHKEGTFWVYGQERLCYVPKYPSKCSIL